MPSPLPLHSQLLKKHPPPKSAGFTLVELLISAILGSLVLVGAAFLAVSGIRATSGQAVAQRYQMGFGRLSHILETEVSEGIDLDYGQATASCPAGNNGIQSIFSIDVPVLVRDEGAAVPAQATIFYYQVGNDLWRCGPAVQADGTLNPANITAGVLLTDAQLFIQNGLDNQLQYAVRMTDPRSAAVFDSRPPNEPGWLTARTRSFQISSP